MPELNLDTLSPTVRRNFQPFAESLLSIYSDNLVSLMIYGSAAGSNYIDGVSDINSCAVLKETGIPILTHSLKLINKYRPKRIVPPLFLTEEYIRRSLDVFPIEFYEMQQSYAVVYGRDIFTNLTVETSHLRLFCEQQIKSALIRIQQVYLEVGSNPKELRQMIHESMSSIVPLFRNLVRLMGDEPEKDKEALIIQACQKFDLEGDVFTKILSDVTGRSTLSKHQLQPVLADFYRQAQKLSFAVDQF